MTDIEELVKRLQESAINWLNEVESRTQAAEALETLHREAHHWKANHDNQVAKAALLAQRPDLPVDRIPAYKEMERLQSEVETLRSQLNDMMTEHGNRLDECARLRVELEEARKDAERYRWLRDKNNTLMGATTCRSATIDLPHSEYLDAAIDAARQKQG